MIHPSSLREHLSTINNYDKKIQLNILSKQRFKIIMPETVKEIDGIFGSPVNIKGKNFDNIK
jgi:pyruvate/oxaloacetate carboxyltransferase